MKRRTRTPPTTPDIHVAVASRAWTRKLRTAVACVRRAAAAAFDGAGGMAPRQAAQRGTPEISVLLTTDTAVRLLNASYRGIDKPTNVLSFSTLSAGKAAALPLDVPALLGDVVIAYGTADREARAAGKNLAAHLSYLVVHGVLHLLGYDHQGECNAMKMEHLETSILAGLGIADPYAKTRKRPLATDEARIPRQKRPARKQART